jgi:hypothetical protein
MMYSHWSQHRYRHHGAVANILDRGTFIAPLSTENNNIPSLKCSVRHWKQIPNFLTALLPTAALYVANKRPLTGQCAPLATRILITNSFVRYWGIFFFVYFFGGLECVGHFFAYVVHF